MLGPVEGACGSIVVCGLMKSWLLFLGSNEVLVLKSGQILGADFWCLRMSGAEV